MHDHKKVKEGYNIVASAYLEGRKIFNNLPYLEKLTALLPKDSTILDSGCGAGTPIDDYLIDQGYKIKGFDISEKQIELAKKYVPQGEYEVKDMADLREGEYSVDAIVCLYALIHVKREKHLEVLKKFKSFLKENGLLLITMGSSDWEGTEEFFGAPMQWSHYDAKRNLELVKEAGLEIVFSEVDKTAGENHLIILARNSR